MLVWFGFPSVLAHPLYEGRLKALDPPSRTPRSPEMPTDIRKHSNYPIRVIRSDAGAEGGSGELRVQSQVRTRRPRAEMHLAMDTTVVLSCSFFWSFL